jgi:hypothetical protein
MPRHSPRRRRQSSMSSRESSSIHSLSSSSSPSSSSSRTRKQRYRVCMKRRNAKPVELYTYAYSPNQAEYFATYRKRGYRVTRVIKDPPKASRQSERRTMSSRTSSKSKEKKTRPLSSFGYGAHASKSARMNALLRAVRAFSYPTIIQRVRALRNLTKPKQPNNSRIYDEDKKDLEVKYKNSLRSKG